MNTRPYFIFNLKPFAFAFYLHILTATMIKSQIVFLKIFPILRRSFCFDYSHQRRFSNNFCIKSIQSMPPIQEGEILLIRSFGFRCFESIWPIVVVFTHFILPSFCTLYMLRLGKILIYLCDSGNVKFPLSRQIA